MHHFRQCFAIREVANCVVVVVEQRRDPRFKARLGDRNFKPLSKDGLRLFALENANLVAHARSDEVHRIWAIPMLELVLSLPVLI